MIYTLSILFCLLFLFFVVEMIRRRKISERYSLLWLFLGLVMLLFSLIPSLLNQLAGLVGVVYGTSLLFFIAFLFSLVFILHLTTVITKLDRKMTRLTQEIALLRAKQEEEAASARSADRTN